MRIANQTMPHLRRNMQVHIAMAHTFFFFLIFIFSSNVSTNVHACNQSERSSLLSFSRTLSSSPPLNWTAVNCCHWEGITCNPDGLITHLSLPSKEMKLKGDVFPSTISLANLTHLTHLNLSHNSLYGSLDQSAFFLCFNNLEILDLSYNLLFGNLPFSLPFTHIQTLDFSSNHFYGEIPSSIFQQSWNWTSFNVSNNSFTGSIPSSYICLHSNPLVKQLDFSFNKFNGNISPGLGKCSNLKVFRASHNNLSGLLPEDIYNATKLEEIALPVNSLHGKISEKIANLSHLKILSLNSNHLSGVLPAGIGKLSDLQVMLLDLNNLEGSLPPSLMNCSNLKELRLAINNFTGDITKVDFSKLSKLNKLDLGDNKLTGVVPVSLFSCKFLKAIRLSHNNLEGQIPREILSLKSLSFLSLSENRLTNVTRAMKILMRCRSLVFLALESTFVDVEKLADVGIFDFGGLQKLRFLDLGCCHLGHIPIWLSKLKKLEILYMDNNEIKGPIPSWLGTLPNLFYLNLGYNSISGEFPKALCKLPKLVSAWPRAQVDDDNELELPMYGSQPGESGNLSVQYTFSCFAPEINLGYNSMNGSIPIEIGQLQHLIALHLHNNKFSGRIPEQLSNLKNLDELILSRNQFTGTIPSSFTGLSSLSKFDVSYNNLAGAIPRGTQLQLMDPSAFEGNPKLCGTPLPKECQPTEGNDPENSKTSQDNATDHIPWFYISAVLGFIIGFWGVCCPLVLKKKWRYGYFRFLDRAQDRLAVMILTRVYGNRVID